MYLRRTKIVLACSINPRERTTPIREQKYVPVQSSFVAQATRDLAIRDCCFVGSGGGDHFLVAAVSFTERSGVLVSLRRSGQRLVWWERGRTVCHGSLHSRFLLLFPNSDPFTDRQDRRNSSSCDVFVGSSVC